MKRRRGWSWGQRSQELRPRVSGCDLRVPHPSPARATARDPRAHLGPRRYPILQTRFPSYPHAPVIKLNLSIRLHGRLTAVLNSKKVRGRYPRAKSGTCGPTAPAQGGGSPAPGTGCAQGRAAVRGGLPGVPGAPHSSPVPHGPLVFTAYR